MKSNVLIVFLLLFPVAINAEVTMRKSENLTLDKCEFSGFKMVLEKLSELGLEQDFNVSISNRDGTIYYSLSEFESSNKNRGNLSGGLKLEFEYDVVEKTISYHHAR